MEPEIDSPTGETAPGEAAVVTAIASETESAAASTTKRGLKWVFSGSQGLRAGWSVLVFAVLFSLFTSGLGFVFAKAHLLGERGHPSAASAFFGEVAGFLSLLGAAALVGLMEHRSVLAYNLTGPRRGRYFVSGLVAGFVALSVLVGALALGGWLHLGSGGLSGAEVLQYGALWGGVFLLVGCLEEGMFRCYLQFTLTRGINFWWALGIVAAMCLDLALRAKGNGVWGVYGVALLGLAPCFVLERSHAARSGFWQAAWVTSMVFGFVHTGNNGENWIGIFAAAAIGFVFCVSIWVTGSAWWAIGCHAAWDWAETYFYGTADSGMVAKGHLLSASPAGNVLWSGGTDGPEGSLLVLGVILLLLAAVVAIHGRGRDASTAGQEAARL